MERAESKGEDAPAVTTERTDPAEAKGGAVTVSASDEAKETTEDIPSATDAVIVVEETKGGAVAPPGRVVVEVLADIVASVSTTAAAAAAPAEPPSENRSKQRKRRLAVLQDDVDVETSETKEGGAAPRQLPPLKCVIDGDANMMATGAEECTTLNSDEDPSLQDEPESEDDSDNDDEEWVEDWNIGELTDEEMDEEEAPLPDSVCLTAARNKKAMSMMKTHGTVFVVDPNKFGSDPTYAGLYDGPFGPSASVMPVADDPLALLFYFMSPKLWTQIAAESNRYHRQSIPLRARPM
ncbi:hypothetical protein ON010_g17970 [Phytophthora cinnamomi]|nr:hypothetical protein ON010_g17970 [Phytophthora cinnamomi]